MTRPATPRTPRPEKKKPAALRLSFEALVLGAIALAAHFLTRDVRSNEKPLKQVLPYLHKWLPIVGWTLLGVAVLCLIVHLLMGRRHGSDPTARGGRNAGNRAAARVLGAAASTLPCTPDDLTLSRSKWRRGQLRRGILSYPPGAIPADHTIDLRKALNPFLAGPAAVTWDPAHDLFRITEQAPTPPRIEDLSRPVAAVASHLSHVFRGTVVIDQRRTTVDPAGAPTRIIVSYPQTTSDLSDGFRQRVLSILDRKAPNTTTGYWSCRWDTQLNELTIEPTAPLPEFAPYPVDVLAPGSFPNWGGSLPLGVLRDGQPCLWTPSKVPHLLVIGRTGGGKTSLLHSLLISALARSGGAQPWEVYVADAKLVSFRGFHPEQLAARNLPPWPGLRTVATRPAEFEKLLTEAVDEMYRRYAGLEDFSLKASDIGPRLLILDEVSEMIAVLNEYWASEAKLEALQREARDAGNENWEKVKKPTGSKHPIANKLWSILRLGRQVGIFVVLGIQRPDVSFIPGEARDNVTGRVGVGYLRGDAMEMLFETRSIQQQVDVVHVDPATGARTRQRVPGRSTVDVGGGIQTVQVFFTPDPAEVITGEASPQNAAHIQALHERLLTIQHSQPRAAAPAPADPVTLHKVTARLEATAASTDETVTESGSARPDDLPTRPARDLRTGDQAVIEVDGEYIAVTVTEIQDDPYSDPDYPELEFTYRIDAGPQAGSEGTTTFDPSEPISQPT